jgi:O-antigen ligase
MELGKTAAPYALGVKLLRFRRKEGNTIVMSSNAAFGALRRSLILQTLLCTAPSSVFLVLGNTSLAGLSFWGVLMLLLLRLAILGKRDEMLCLVLALAPAISLLRTLAPFYNLVSVLSFCVLAYYKAQSEGKAWNILRRYPMTIALACYITLYYAFSFVITGDYSAQIRLFDFLLSALIVVIIGRRRELLSAGLLGLVISSVIIGLAMLPYIGSTSSSRLGLVIVGGVGLGHPGTLGASLALSFLALLVDRARWLDLQRKWAVRILLAAPALILLALTSSRASWMVAVAGILVSFLFDRRSRLKTIVFIGLACLAIQLVLMSPYGSSLQRGIERTFGDDRSIAVRTTGRADQWIAAYAAFTASPQSIMWGYGPGSGYDIYAKYSREVQSVKFAVGEKLAWHSLYLQLAVEAGLLGLIPFLAGLLIVLVKTLGWTRKHRAVFPLVSFVGYALTITAVSGNDSVSGVMLGIGLLATIRETSRRTQHVARLSGEIPDRSVDEPGDSRA